MVRIGCIKAISRGKLVNASSIATLVHLKMEKIDGKSCPNMEKS
jgi:hypothetical protein